MMVFMDFWKTAMLAQMILFMDYSKCPLPRICFIAFLTIVKRKVVVGPIENDPLDNH